MLNEILRKFVDSDPVVIVWLFIIVILFLFLFPLTFSGAIVGIGIFIWGLYKLVEYLQILIERKIKL